MPATTDVSSPLSLAVFRGVLFSTLAWYALTAYDVAWFAALPDALRTPPIFTEWYAALPLTPDVVRAGQWALVLTAVLAALGCYTRITSTAAAVLALLVIGVPQLYGWKVDHPHHLVWFAAILAASPSGDALSIDAWRRGGTPPPPSPAYGVPLRFAWALMGLLYLFPGLAKAALLPQWGSAANLQFHLYEKWAELDGFQPVLPVDQWPLVLSLAAAGTILFELSFIVLVWFRRTRWLVLAGGLLFHTMTSQMMAISFLSLQLCYVALVPWERVAAWWRGVPGETAADRRPATLPTLIVGATLVAGVAVASVLNVDSWPFSIYPTFGYLSRPTLIRAELVPVDASGTAMAVSPATWSRIKYRMKTARWERILRRLGGRIDPAERDRIAAAVFTVLVREDPTLATATTLDLYLTTRSVLPSERDQPPRGRTRVARIALAP